MKGPGNNKSKAVYFRANFLNLALIALLFISTNSCKKAENNTIELVFTSWRIDDVEEMNRINAQFTAQNPNITVKFYSPGDINYDSVTISNLSKGVGAHSENQIVQNLCRL